MLTVLPASVLLSVAPNPNSFDTFKSGGEDVYARFWANESKSGNFCVPLDLSASGASGVEDGANVTIQIVVNGGDGQLYQVRTRHPHHYGPAFPTLTWLCLVR